MSDAAVSAFAEAWPFRPMREANPVARAEALEALAVALEDFLGDEDVDGRIPVALGFHRNPVTPASNAFALSPRAWE